MKKQIIQEIKKFVREYGYNEHYMDELIRDEEPYTVNINDEYMDFIFDISVLSEEMLEANNPNPAIIEYVKEITYLVDNIVALDNVDLTESLKNEKFEINLIIE